MRVLALPAVLTLTLVAPALTGCGGDDPPPQMDAPSMTAPPAGVAQAAAPAGPRRARRPGTRVTVISSQLGRILGDGRGQAFYLFDKERRGRSECYGACAEAWPPVLAKGRPVAGDGVRARWLGTTRRRDGARQVTYRGRPLYYYIADAPGRVLCHDVREFGGLWLVIRPDGTPVP
jgi:predicted lipoprotein with Yx(FWY)xxD motif